jgi:isoleucyl-tRNA synthetase
MDSMAGFRKVDAQANFVAQEHEVLDFWQQEQVFEHLRALRAGAPRWSFLDGPITANNPMGVHHAWGRAYKDLQQRYRAMRGFDQRWQNGFDCQGLWVEVNVERDLGFKSKRDIEAYGIEPFIRLCKQRVLQYAAIQTEQSIRLGQWMRWDDPATLRLLGEKLIEDPSQPVTIRGAAGEITDTAEQLVGRLGSPEVGGSYFTFSDENNYCIWTFLKRCHERGLIYRGRDVVPWCARCGTAMSDHEIETEGYHEKTHQAVFVRLPILKKSGGEAGTRTHHSPLTTHQPAGPDEGLLVWTTTPWTLTSNVAVAVGPQIEYLKIRQDGQVSYVARDAAQRAVRGEYEELAALRGEEMLGWTYAGPYDELQSVREAGAPEAHRIIPWSEVSADEGTGMVHIAPGCGAEDFQLGREYGLPAVAPLDESGNYVAGFGRFTGQPAAGVAPEIVRDLREKGLLYRAESFTHRYPTCWRCHEDLVFRLVDEWFISMGPVYGRPLEEVTEEEKQASLRYQIMELVDQIRWIPAFGREREMDWLRNMQDWMISKKRYWGLALPIWECESCGHFDVIGSREEVSERATDGWEVFEGHTPHRPFIDAVKIACVKCGAAMNRIPDVGNPWLDAGIVPYSTMGYRRDRRYWEKWFPAQFITESFPGQFRNWFYSLLTMSAVLENRAPFETVLGFATLLGEDGKPMHKSAGNFIDFYEGAENIGVDVTRWMFVSQRPEANLLFGYNTAREARRQFLIPLWNCYAFFTNYAELEPWTPDRRTPHRSTLDRWLISRLQILVREVTAAFDDYDHVAGTQALLGFVDELSTWYVRRSRRRFWKSEADEDKLAAYTTLYDSLVTLAKLLAPALPFVAEGMYQNLVRAVDAGAPISVHLCDWPAADPTQVDDGIMRQMELAIAMANAGRAARAAGNLKLRQPVAGVSVYVAPDRRVALPDELLDVVREELNARTIRFVEDVSALASYRVLPNNQLLGPKFGKLFPRVRQALLALDAAAVAQRAQAGQAVELDLDGERLTLTPEEILVHTEPKPGLAVAAEAGVTVAVDTQLSDDLVREGAARDLVRQIQNLRKDAGFEMDDRIETQVLAAGDVARAVEEHRDYIAAETLSRSVELQAQPPAETDGWFNTAFQLQGEPVAVFIRRVY